MGHTVEQPDIESLVRRNRELEQLEQDHRRMELIFKQQAHNLQERMKEINCLYGISKILEQTGLSLEETFQKVVNIIPPSWQYPEITCAQLLINGQSFRTKNYKNTFWKQQAEIIAYGEPMGILTVCYLEKRPDLDEGAFLAEERSLINAIAEHLGRTIERKMAENELRESRRKLKEQNQQLKEKNIALREVMSQLREEKADLEERILANVENLLLPLVKRMGDRGSDLDKEYLRLLEENIAQLTSSFGSKICHLNQRLTPRESEICNMIRAGLGSKEIGKMLNISYRSVETYRKNKKKKLGITNKKINLTSYLSGL